MFHMRKLDELITPTELDVEMKIINIISQYQHI